MTDLCQEDFVMRPTNFLRRRRPMQRLGLRARPHLELLEDRTLLSGGLSFMDPPIEVASGGGPRSVAVGNFDPDGIPDLAVANSTSGNVSIFLGNGDGTF